MYVQEIAIGFLYSNRKTLSKYVQIGKNYYPWQNIILAGLQKCNFYVFATYTNLLASNIRGL